MVSYTKIQKVLWEIAGFDSLILGYCDTLYNRAAVIGLYFIFQLLLLFSGTYLLFSLWFDINGLIVFVLALLVVGVFYRAIKAFVQFAEFRYKYVFISLILMLGLAISVVLAFVCSIVLYTDEIVFQQLSNPGNLSVSSIQFWKDYDGLWLMLADETKMAKVLSFCAAIFLILLFLFSFPYFLILGIYQSNYNLLRINYGQNFK